MYDTYAGVVLCFAEGRLVVVKVISNCCFLRLFFSGGLGLVFFFPASSVLEGTSRGCAPYEHRPICLSIPVNIDFCDSVLPTSTRTNSHVFVSNPCNLVMHGARNCADIVQREPHRFALRLSQLAWDGRGISPASSGQRDCTFFPTQASIKLPCCWHPSWIPLSPLPCNEVPDISRA